METGEKHSARETREHYMALWGTESVDITSTANTSPSQREVNATHDEDFSRRRCQRGLSVAFTQKACMPTGV